MLTPGTKLGDYLILRTLGSGGMGHVYLGQSQISKRIDALKTVQQGIPDEYQVEPRFLREIEILAALHHPHISNLYTAFRANGYLVMAMEFVEGRTIKDIIEEEGLSVEQSLSMATQVLDALGFAHSRGVLHRDVKSSNIMLRPDGLAKLMDFGIARAEWSAELTQGGILPGSAYYASPEHLLGHPMDERSDIYSLGTVLYHATTRTHPFRGDYSSLAHQHAVKIPERPEMRNPDIPGVVSDLILKALAKNPADRFQTASEFREAVESAVQRLANKQMPVTVLAAKPVPPPLVPPLPAESTNPEEAHQSGAASVMAASLEEAQTPEMHPLATSTPTHSEEPPEQVRDAHTDKPSKTGFGVTVALPEATSSSAVGPPVKGHEESTIDSHRKAGRSETEFGQARKPRPAWLIAVSLMLAVFVLAIGYFAWRSSADKADFEPRPPETQPQRVTRLALPMQFVTVPAGEFTMGCAPGGGGCPEASLTPQSVRIAKDFEIGKYEVTQREWATVMGTHPSYAEGDEHPVELVSWNDVQAFLGKLNAQNDGYHYRLPTEAEWEYAARAVGRYDPDVTAGGSAGEGTVAVSTTIGNARGIHGFADNVREWCADEYLQRGGQQAVELDTLGGKGPLRRTVRGGSWETAVATSAVALRSGYLPDEKHRDVGFRCLRERRQ